MTEGLPDRLAVIHAAAFIHDRPWSAKELAALMASPHVFACALPNSSAPHAFALGRVVAGEAELLTIACASAHQGQGFGRAALQAFEAEARLRAADQAFLDVADDNAPARGLYQRAGYIETGRRKAYYRRKGRADADACLMVKQLA
ncbi:N-acetyltransferase [Litorivita sp. NS0012-18]|uniref:GNAT family N-acetyltransferase n=1 Tax=Litorivita sp. NS0012-18 TaxID=3127655 RepID=UPI00310880AC